MNDHGISDSSNMTPEVPSSVAGHPGSSCGDVTSHLLTRTFDRERAPETAR